MLRTTVLAVVVSIGGAPALSVVCRLLCAEHAHGAATPCHESGSSPVAQLRGSGEVCDHTPVVMLYLTTSVVTLDASHAPTGLVASTSAQATTAHPSATAMGLGAGPPPPLLQVSCTTLPTVLRV